MTKLISLPALMALLIGTSALAAPRQGRAQTISKRFDFASKPSASFQSNKIDFFFSDVPANQVVNGRDLSLLPGATLAERLTAELAAPMAEGDLYQLTQVYDRMDSKVSGQAIAYHNRSDDTDVNLQIVVGNTAADKLKPNTVYQITAKLDFVTNVSSELFGIGGSADSNSFGLAVSQSPWISAVPGNGPSLPEEPSKPSTPSELDNYYGIPASFFIESSELSELADASIDSLNAAELVILAKGVTVSPSNEAAYKAALLKNLKAAYQKALTNLGKVLPSDALQVRLSKELDLNVKAKLSDMSPEDIENLKSMFGEGSGPVMILAATATMSAASDGSADIRRTTTKDSNGKTVSLGVPSGSCNNAPLGQLTGDTRWICERYSYMGRINNGKDEAHKEWTANSIATKAPLEFRTDASGNPIYLNLNSHSGFEGLTLYYVTGIEYKVVEKK